MIIVQGTKQTSEYKLVISNKTKLVNFLYPFSCKAHGGCILQEYSKEVNHRADLVGDIKIQSVTLQLSRFERNKYLPSRIFMSYTVNENGRLAYNLLCN